MSATLMILVTLAYVVTSVSELIKGNWPMGLVFGSYALANVGLIAAIK
jgi:hypothetical protein